MGKLMETSVAHDLFLCAFIKPTTTLTLRCFVVAPSFLLDLQVTVASAPRMLRQPGLLLGVLLLAVWRISAFRTIYRGVKAPTPTSIFSKPSTTSEAAKMTHRYIDTEDPVRNKTDQGEMRVSSYSPEIAAILMVYFVQGALGLSRLATTFFLKDQLHLTPAESAALMGLTSIPWMIKPVYGILSDGFPLFGYRRRSYIALAGVVGCISWLALGSAVSDTSSALAAITLGSASVAVSDVVVDSIVVERSKVPERTTSEPSQSTLSVAGDLQSLCWGASAVGGIMSAYFSGSLLETFTPQTVFIVTAIFPLLITLSSLFINERPVIHDAMNKDTGTMHNDANGLWSQLTTLFRTVATPSIYLPVLFVFLWQATPSPDSAMFYFYTNELGFPPEFLGKLRLFSSVASLGGVLLYRSFLKDIPLQQILFWTALASAPLGLSQVILTNHWNLAWGVPNEVFTLTDSVVLTVLGQISFMPILALAASLCPPGVEGTLFASLMSIFNAAGTVGSELGAGLTAYLGVTDRNFEHLSLLVVICSLSSLLPLPFMGQLLGKVGGSSGTIETDGRKET